MTDPADPGGARGGVRVEDEQTLTVDVLRMHRMASRVLARLGVQGELAVTLVDEERVAELKEQAFGTRERTDVLSFPMDDPDDPAPGPVVLGDIVICPAVAARQARALGRTLEAELDLLLVHGVLHILGRDHADPSSERAMAAEERALLEEVRAS